MTESELTILAIKQLTFQEGLQNEINMILNLNISNFNKCNTVFSLIAFDDSLRQLISDKCKKIKNTHLFKRDN
jgi:hypothetical protein